ncbi:DJ-1/PfpI family protein (plasmid) [Methylocystis sp. MJC1]|uniref:DJ-1/PfpI family protein n=1 Tax=Methylocystis sp. MJC1 TaxID=2654282 RepID=UPI0013ED0C6C|nr:DJ-1/PfpI family protein [Methylocystis sp. MJC1]KAF2989281.1 Isonitrile hydratase [Methylocystis sp. MJC1]MBU6529313.1 DJ-1/PfpI family protein [Methylocystis sp. MJC1]UZX14173.1 DJ-1/PfpI family protein [Methylocystis sp. MJC1]
MSDQNPPKLKVAMLVYPRLTLLDLAGPQSLWCMQAETYLVWESLDPVVTDTDLTLQPTHTFETCPTDVDILCVPGGFGAWDVINNARAMDYLARAGAEARYVTGICFGTIIMAAAGLLDGYRAATHWATYPMLESLGVEGVRERVVIDRNRITGGGVTAGVDFGLTVLSELRGETVAKATQLLIEYNPKPPFNAGSPEAAGPELTAFAASLVKDDFEQNAMPAVMAAAQRRKAAAR